MAIGNVVHRGIQIFVYDEKGRQICTIPAEPGPQVGLVGYTSSTINFRRSQVILTFNEHGRQIATTPAR
jgi:hypothetical protein